MSFALARALAVLRILLGVTFVCIGVSILTNHDLLFGGLLEYLNSTGGPANFYKQFVVFIERRETFILYFAAGLSIAMGVSYIAGLLISLTSLAASFSVLNYAFATSSGHLTRFAVISVVALALLVFGRFAPGMVWGVDGWLVDRLQDWLVLFPLRRRAPKIIYPPPKSFVG